MKINKKKWIRNCLKCNNIIEYSLKHNFNRAVKNNTLCKSCVKFGKNNPRHGKSNYNIWLEKYGKEIADKKEKNRNEKHGNTINGKNNPMYNNSAYNIWLKKYGKEKADRKQNEANRKNSESNLGKKYNDIAKKNMRISAIKRIEKQKGQIMPNSNPKATQIIRAKAKEVGITDLRDAETPGGEFQVCGYFVDGRSEEKNIVIEYYEGFHKKQVERDERRKQEIINELGCKFIEIKEWEL
jgi:very-short-patch-repair endonuclease